MIQEIDNINLIITNYEKEEYVTTKNYYYGLLQFSYHYDIDQQIKMGLDGIPIFGENFMILILPVMLNWTV